MLVCVYVCVCVCMCVCVGVGMCVCVGVLVSYHHCNGQREGSDNLLVSRVVDVIEQIRDDTMGQFGV